MTDHNDPLAENAVPATVSDEQLLDLYLTAWVAGSVDLTLHSIPKLAADHLVGCEGCTKATIDTFKARLTLLWEDPAARHAVLDVCRAVLAGENRAPKFVHVAVKAGDR